METIAVEGSTGDSSFRLFGLGRLLDDALAAIETIGSDAVTQVSLTRLRVDRQGRFLETVVRTVHTARRGRLAAFLNGHLRLLKKCAGLKNALSRYFHLRFSNSASCANGLCVSSSGPSDLPGDAAARSAVSTATPLRRARLR